MDSSSPTLLLIGSNIGNREQFLSRARELIAAGIGEIVKKSPIYETEPWGDEDQPRFLNQALEVRHTMSPRDLLDAVEEIEEEIGKGKMQHWGARRIDVDILFMGNLIEQRLELQIPHPLVHERRFTLAPLADIAPDYIHPLIGETVQDMLDHCTDPLTVEKYPGDAP